MPLIIVFCNSVDTVAGLAHLARSVLRSSGSGREAALDLSSAAGAARRTRSSRSVEGA